MNEIVISSSYPLDDTANIQQAVSTLAPSARGRLIFPDKEYLALGTVCLPQESNLLFEGGGFRQSTIYSSGAPIFNYQRQAGRGAAMAQFNALQMYNVGVQKAANSRAIVFQGLADGFDDNWLRVKDCAFNNFEGAIETKWAGQAHFTDNYYQGNRYSHLMRRGSSFFYFSGCMSFDSTFIHARDTVHDSYSNGLFLDSCNNITATAENMFVEGWQAVYANKCGFDLGSGGASALWFYQSRDISIADSFISSNNSTTRAGIRMEASHSYNVRANTIVNNSVGILCTEPPLSLGCKGVIDSNNFDGNDTNDVLVLSNCEALKIARNHFSKQMSRTGTNFEVYANLPGVNNLIIQENTFRGSSYPLVAGPNSVIGNNLFNVKA